MPQSKIDLEPVPCMNSDYKVSVLGYLFGQHRLQLIRIKDDEIVREACTYNPSIAANTLMCILSADDPEAFMERLAKPWNCEHKGGRIRLDNKEGDRIG